MFPKAPNVEVYAPTTLFAGNNVEIEIVITAEQAVKVEYVDATITGRQSWSVSAGENSSVGRRVEYPRLVARLRGEGEIAVGTTRFRATFQLPRDMPPSHTMRPALDAWASLELFVRVAIPWWPDGKYKFTLPVRLPPPPTVERTPYAIRSSAAADEPRLELSLASTNLIVGETVVGSVAVFHLDDKKPRDVDLTLVPTVRLIRGRHALERRGTPLGVTVTIPAGGAGTSVPFRFQLTSDVTPTFKAHTHELAWWLVAKSGSFFGTKVELNVPLNILDASASAKSERLTVAPRLSDERITAAFARFATEHGWLQRLDEDEPDQLLYERRAGDVTLRLGYAYRGEDGAFLVARVAYPSLGLDLHVTPSSRVRQIFSKDIEIDLADWDRAHHVAARSSTQAIPYLRSAAAAVANAGQALGSLKQWGDDEVVFEHKVTGIEQRDLQRASDALEVLAQALSTARIVPPQQFGVDEVEAWKQLAQRLQGRLTIGDLSIAGTLDQRPVAIELAFIDERAIRANVEVGDAATAVEHQPLTEEELAEGFAELLGLRLENGIASASLPIRDRLDAARVKEVVTWLRALLARREPNRGPYR